MCPTNSNIGWKLLPPPNASKKEHSLDQATFKNLGQHAHSRKSQKGIKREDFNSQTPSRKTKLQKGYIFTFTETLKTFCQGNQLKTNKLENAFHITPDLLFAHIYNFHFPPKINTKASVSSL